MTKKNFNMTQRTLWKDNPCGPPVALPSVKKQLSPSWNWGMNAYRFVGSQRARNWKRNVMV
jgi:hypothetical protein